MSVSTATRNSGKRDRRNVGKSLDALLIIGASVGIIVMGFAWAGVQHDKKWAEARQVLVATHAEIERRLMADREEWEAMQRRRIRQLEAEEPDGTDAEEMRTWREELQAERERSYTRDVRRVLDVRNGDRILLSLQWQGTLRYFRRGDFYIYAGGNRPSEESEQAYFIEVVAEPGAYGDDEEILDTPDGVLRIYSDGSIEGPLPLSETTDPEEDD